MLLELRRGMLKSPESIKQVVLLQSLLAELNPVVKIDGVLGAATVSAVEAFQQQNGLVVDGVVAEKTWVKLIAAAPQLFEKIAALWLSQADLDEVATAINVERAAVKSVYEVEAQGAGFLGLKPKILFEGHIFWRLLEQAGKRPQQFVAGNEDVLYPAWTTRFYLGGLQEYDRLEKAKAIDESLALQSASWGLFQIMGNNFRVAGFDSVENFVAAMQQSERAHLDAFASFIGETRFQGVTLRELLAARDWEKFARAYNGPSYRANKYDTKLQAAYESAKARIG
jgi:N-acetylmuramidase/Putative peptidoglycan binding domain